MRTPRHLRGCPSPLVPGLVPSSYAFLGCGYWQNPSNLAGVGAIPPQPHGRRIVVGHTFEMSETGRYEVLTQQIRERVFVVDDIESVGQDRRFFVASSQKLGG